MAAYAICECTDPACRLRYPAGTHETAARRCPRCCAPVIMLHRLPERNELQSPLARDDRSPALAVLLDNVRSLLNVGSIFRSADGAGFDMLYLCGVTPTPENTKLAKTALGAERSLNWIGRPNAVALAHELLAAGHRLWVLEEHADAESLFAAPAPPSGTVLVVGSEVAGVDPDLLALCERKLVIPMRGRKRSLNVATAFGIAAVILANLEPPV